MDAMLNIKKFSHMFADWVCATTRLYPYSVFVGYAIRKHIDFHGEGRRILRTSFLLLVWYTGRCEWGGGGFHCDLVPPKRLPPVVTWVGKSEQYRVICFLVYANPKSILGYLPLFVAFTSTHYRKWHGCSAGARILRPWRTSFSRLLQRNSLYYFAIISARTRKWATKFSKANVMRLTMTFSPQFITF